MRGGRLGGFGTCFLAPSPSLYITPEATRGHTPQPPHFPKATCVARIDEETYWRRIAVAGRPPFFVGMNDLRPVSLAAHYYLSPLTAIAFGCRSLPQSLVAACVL